MSIEKFEQGNVVFDNLQFVREQELLMPSVEGMEELSPEDRTVLQSLYEELLPKFQPGGELSGPYDEEGASSPEEFAAITAVSRLESDKRQHADQLARRAQISEANSAARRAQKRDRVRAWTKALLHQKTIEPQQDKA